MGFIGIRPRICHANPPEARAREKHGDRLTGEALRAALHDVQQIAQAAVEHPDLLLPVAPVLNAADQVAMRLALRQKVQQPQLPRVPPAQVSSTEH